ncbi:MAG TPA: hypothetical protein VMG10_21650 [Gemmataceae bacterium]|nr:hypothetical protein [Gemmataceae bacterium]
MKRVLSFTIAALTSVPLLNAAEPAPNASADTKTSRPMPKTFGKMAVADFTRVWQRARIVKDLAAFDLSKLSSKTTGAWIVARIRPGGLSGALYGPRNVITVGGQWKLIELLSGKAPREGRYQWEYPYINHSWDRDWSILDYGSVFEGSGGAVICQFFEKKTGIEQFSSVTQIPDGWKSFVKPAHQYYVKHTADFAGDDLKKLKKLALGDNPFIGLEAIRHILDRKTAAQDMDMFVELAHSLPKYRQAVLISRLLKRNDDTSRTIVLKAISQANNSGELTGLALGIYIWDSSHGWCLGSPPAHKMFNKLRERWQSFDPSAADTKWLHELLSRALGGE